VSNASHSERVKSALARFATGVVVLSVRDGLPPSPSSVPVDASADADRSDDFDFGDSAGDPADDLALTVTAFMPVSLFPPLVAVAVDSGGYLAEVLTRRAHWGLSVLDAGQASLAGRFSAAGRPSARLLLAGEPHHRGTETGALLLDGGRAWLECRTTERHEVGDHLLLIGAVLAADAPRSPGRSPLIRYDRSYRNLTSRG
jgi:flavin reductase (DIM6/NTAB) family NADH-FMN oxidoreductase RutF